MLTLCLYALAFVMCASYPTNIIPRPNSLPPSLPSSPHRSTINKLLSSWSKHLKTQFTHDE